MCATQKTHPKWQKSICKGAKDTDPLMYHSHVCSKSFTKIADPLCARSTREEAASCLWMYKKSSVRGSGITTGLYLAVQWHKYQESYAFDTAFTIKAFHLHAVLVNHR